MGINKKETDTRTFLCLHKCETKASNLYLNFLFKNTYLIPNFVNACVVKPPLNTTVAIETIKTVVNISCLGNPLVFLIAKAKATAPRRPKQKI